MSHFALNSRSGNDFEREFIVNTLPPEIKKVFLIKIFLPFWVKTHKIKIINSTKPVGSFGGLNFISNEFNKLELDSLIEKHLDEKSLQSRYSF